MTRHDRRSGADLVRARDGRPSGAGGDVRPLRSRAVRHMPAMLATATPPAMSYRTSSAPPVKLGQLRDPDRLKPWLYAIARHEIYRRTARRKRSVSLEAVVAESGREPVAAEHAAADGRGHIGAELAAVVRGAAAGLDAEDQLVLELSARQGLSGADLAAALGIDSAPAANKLVFRMRQRLGALSVPTS